MSVDIGGRPVTAFEGFATALVIASNAPAALIAAARLAQASLGSLVQICDGADDDVQIQSALNALPAGGGIVQLSSGTFSTTSPITMPAVPATLRGAGAYGVGAAGTKISAAQNGIIIVMADNCSLYNLQLVGPGRASLSSVGASLSANYNRIADVSIQGVYKGVLIGAGGTWGSSLDRISIDNVDYGIHANNVGGTQACLKTHGLWMSGVYTYGMDLGKADACEFIDVDIFGLGTATRGGVRIQSDVGGMNKFVDVHVDGKGLGAFNFVVPAGSTLTGLIFLLNCSGSALNNYFGLNIDASAVATPITAPRAVGCNFSADGGAINLNNVVGAKIIGCDINPRQAAVVCDGISLTASTRCVVIGNRFTQTPNNNIAEYTTSDYNLYAHNVLASAQNIFMANGHSKTVANIGFVTENAGAGAIASGTTSSVITHGLSKTPSARNISITPTNNPTNDPGNIWVDTITATQFTVHCRADPGVSTLTFEWQAAVL